ncbi:hypothetical protein BVG79_00514 [Ketogulonicigenium robustum]|uniref:Uncharacterized protein n=1 Tax=Ketogulonicigenium robustum TaxID=92947 RepID=A0A1W6NX95_9RHOB|nr:hypothetical protein BVG79_00514 [Ketogulonicigenium robustum]
MVIRTLSRALCGDASVPHMRAAQASHSRNALPSGAALIGLNGQVKKNNLYVHYKTTTACKVS